jgi:hypothetical protein
MKMIGKVPGKPGKKVSKTLSQQNSQVQWNMTVYPVT